MAKGEGGLEDCGSGPQKSPDRLGSSTGLQDVLALEDDDTAIYRTFPDRSQSILCIIIRCNDKIRNKLPTYDDWPATNHEEIQIVQLLLPT